MRFAIRADASLQMGSGHVMRCLTLAKLLTQQGHSITFICRAHDGHLAQVIKQNGFAIHLLAKGEHNDFTKVHAHSDWLGVSETQDFADCQPILTQLQPDWLIIDHYAIGKHWESSARNLLPSLKILVIDDLADRLHDCEVLLDQNFGRNHDDYQAMVPPHCRLLLGSRYTLLRDEFCQWRDVSLARRKTIQQPNNSQQPNNILVNLGGVDNDNVTLKILQSLQGIAQINGYSVTVVMGKTAPHIDSVQEFGKQANFPCNVIVNANNMAALMANADLAIGAAGSTTWERCCLGLPMLLIVLADNQQVIAQALAQKNVVKVVTDIAKLDAQLPTLLDDLSKNYKTYSQKSAQLVDGHGSTRVANWLEFTQRFANVAIRPATDADTQLVWRWRNHRDVRQWMFGQEEIALADHETWFGRQLDNRNVHLRIFRVNGEPMGFINVTQSTVDNYQTLQPSKASAPKPNEKTASWGFYLSPDCPKGQGLGFALGVLAISQMFNTTDIGKITAQVFEYNTASLALHCKLGFTEIGVLKQHFGVGDKQFDVVAFELNSANFLF